MIRLAFVAVLALAGLLAFTGFSLVRNTGSAPVPDTAESAPLPADEVLAQEAEPVVTQVPFLQDIDLTTGPLALVLYRAAPDGTDLVVTDPAALQAAQDTATITADAVATDQPDIPRDQRIAALYRNDTLVTVFICPATGCPALSDPATANLMGLLDAARPLPLIEDQYDDYTQYLDALTFIAADPEFALLDRAAVHPLAQQIPSAILVLPTISRRANAPIDVETHAALLKALIDDALPDGVNVQTVSLSRLGNPIVVDNDNGRPATRGGSEIPFVDVVLYSVTVELVGAADLSDDILEALGEQTRLTVDWEEEGKAFIQSLGLACSDCYDVRSKLRHFDQPTIVESTPESYSLHSYDLREAP